MELGGTIPSCLLDTPGKLSKIGLTNNNLTGTIPDVIPRNSSLYNLVAASNNLTGSVPASIVNARDLFQLFLYSNELNGPLPDAFGENMPLLTSMQLNGNALTGVYVCAMSHCAFARVDCGTCAVQLTCSVMQDSRVSPVLHACITKLSLPIMSTSCEGGSSWQGISSTLGNNGTSMP